MQHAGVASTDLLTPLADILAVWLDVDPWQAARLLVRETAEHYNADTAALFRVHGSELGLESGALFTGSKPGPLPSRAYELDWSWKSWSDLPAKGITAGVAVLNEAVAYESARDLTRNPAHRGLWDDILGDINDPVSGFGCMIAVPLRAGGDENAATARDKSVGVLKIERRAGKRPFSDSEYAAFAIVATHLNQILSASRQVRTLVEQSAAAFLERSPVDRLARLPEFWNRLVSASSAEPPTTAEVLSDLESALPELKKLAGTVANEITAALGYKPAFRSRLLTVVRKLQVRPLQPTTAAKRNERLDLAAAGFESLTVPNTARQAALRNLNSWLNSPDYQPYHAQLHWLIDRSRWSVLLDSFHRILPFGTGGRRGPVGIGTNRFNDVSLTATVQGHIQYLKKNLQNSPTSRSRDLSVVIAYDVRQFNDLRRVYNPDLENPLLGFTSKKFAHLAARVYAANGVRVYMLPEDSPAYMSTPELSFAIRHLSCDGGLNISASHNHPDDNGGKFFNASGGQEIPPYDEQMAERAENPFIDYTRDKSLLGVATLPALSDVVAAGLLQPISHEVHDAYIRLNRAQSLSANRNASIVFTPLHGTGGATVGEVLTASDFAVHPVPSQASLDGSFPGVPFRAPNPEVPESMHAGIEVARSVNADAVFACDPDADRLGVCARTAQGDYRFLTGNEIASIVARYKLEALRAAHKLPRRPLVIKTEVTTELIRRIAEDFGATVIGDLLVGFKYHANVLYELETKHQFRNIPAEVADFVIAAEESHGILVTPDIRDKDAAGAAILLAELAAEQRAKGKTLADYLDDTYCRYGYFANVLVSMVMTGAEGLANIQRIQDTLRATPSTSVAGLKVAGVVDHQDPRGVFGEPVSETDRLARNVLVFTLENGAKITIRPSGTEPKNKTYIEVPSDPLPASCGPDQLKEVQTSLKAVAQRIADDFTLQMLRIIEIDLPLYALRISGLVPLDRRVSFVKDFLPGLERQLAELNGGRTSETDVSKWIDDTLRNFGDDARGLVADAVTAYVESERSGLDALPSDRRASRHETLTKLLAFFVKVPR